MFLERKDSGRVADCWKDMTGKVGDSWKDMTGREADYWKDVIGKVADCWKVMALEKQVTAGRMWIWKSS